MKPIGRTLTITGFPQEAFIVLAEIATTEGVPTSEMARRVLVDSLTDYNAPSWYRTFAELDRKRVLTDWFFNQIHECLLRGDSDKLGEIMEKASEMGLNADDMYLRATEISNREITGSQKINDALVLVSEMLSAQKSVKASDITEAATRRGISSYALARAKDMMGVESRRVARYWVWELPGKKE